MSSEEEKSSKVRDSIRSFVNAPQEARDPLAFLREVGGLPILFGTLVSNPENDTVAAAVDYVFGSEVGMPLLTSAEVAPYLLEGLRHESETLRVITMKEVSYLFRSPEGVKYLLASDILPQIVANIGAKSLEVASEAQAFVRVLASSPAGLQLLLGSELELVVTGIMEKDHTRMLRIVSLYLEVSQTSQAAFTALKAAGKFSFLLEFIRKSTTEDPLLLLNALQLLTGLLHSEQGIQVVLESNLLETLLKTLSSAESNPYFGFTAVTVLEFIEQLSTESHKYGIDGWMETAGLLAALKNVFSSEDEVIVAAGITTVCGIASSPNGLSFVLGWEPSTENPSAEEIDRLIGDSLLEPVLAYAPSSRELLQIRSLFGLAEVMKVTSASGATGTHAIACQRLFTALPPSTYDRFLEVLKNPFDDPRVAVYAFLESICSSDRVWGVEFIVYRDGLLDFLLDRKAEGLKVGLESKHRVVCALASNPETPRLVGRDRALQISTYAKEGAYYGKKVIGDPQVLISSESAG